MKKIIFTVTNSLSFDQRMIRICQSLASNGYEVLLVGIRSKKSFFLPAQNFQQCRLRCFAQKGILFYAEYNLRLFFYLLFQKADCICAVDLDTILPCLFATVIKRTLKVYDAHELFCEMKEIASRPRIHRFWKRIEKFTVPRFGHGYTVNEPIALEFKKLYGVEYAVIRNIALLEPVKDQISSGEYFLYQGAVNEGRAFETLIPAMKKVDLPLWICGDGNFMEQAKQLVKENGLEGKVIFKGNVLPTELRSITEGAYAGITLFDDSALSNYYSLANRFFDYMQAGIPQLCVNYPVYASINNEYSFALMVNNVETDTLAEKLNTLLLDKEIHEQLKKNALLARTRLNWQEEEKGLLDFYKKLFPVN